MTPASFGGGGEQHYSFQNPYFSIYKSKCVNQTKLNRNKE